jgi:hypothetical protein
VGKRKKFTISDMLGWLAGIGCIILSIMLENSFDPRTGIFFGIALIALTSWTRRTRNEAIDDMDKDERAGADAERVRQEADWERKLRKMPPASAASSYSILELNEDATEMEIKRAFRKLVKRYHPDRSSYSALSNAEKFRQVQEAYAVLRDHRGFSGH